MEDKTDSGLLKSATSLVDSDMKVEDFDIPLSVHDQYHKETPTNVGHDEAVAALVLVETMETPTNVGADDDEAAAALVVEPPEDKRVLKVVDMHRLPALQPVMGPVPPAVADKKSVDKDSKTSVKTKT